MLKMYNYSILVPYADKYDLMLKAIESIPNRKDIQIILIDNGRVSLSVDKIPNKSIATLEYWQCDPERGAGGARNIGLQKIRGKKTLFMDADDYLIPNAFEVFDKYLESDYDIVFFKSDSIRLLTGEQSNRHMPLNAQIDNYLETGNEDKLRYNFTVPWCKLYNSNLLKDSDIYFDEVRASNDLMFSARAGYKAKKITACNDVVYIVTEGETNQSIVKDKSAVAQFDRYKVAVSQYHFMESIGKKDLRFHLLSFILHSLTDYGFKEFCKYIGYAWKNKVNIFLR